MNLSDPFTHDMIPLFEGWDYGGFEKYISAESLSNHSYFYPGGFLEYHPAGDRYTLYSHTDNGKPAPMEVYLGSSNKIKTVGWFIDWCRGLGVDIELPK